MLANSLRTFFNKPPTFNPSTFIMNTTTTKHLNNSKLVQLYLTLVLLLFCGIASAQSPSLITSKILEDSVLVSSNKEFVYNSLSLTNNTGNKLNLLLRAEMPENWQLVSQINGNIQLQPNETTIIPIRIASGARAKSEWQPVNIISTIEGNAETHTDVYYVKLKEYSKIKANLSTPSIIIPAYQQTINIPLHLKNAGNTQLPCEFSYKNDFFRLDGTQTISLAAGRDTLISIPVTMDESHWSRLTNENIRFTISAGGEAYNVTQNISRIGSILKEHNSAYQQMPLEVEAGVTYQGKNIAPLYYGGIHGKVDLGKDQSLAFVYRTGSLSKNFTLNNQQVRLDYQNRQWDVSAGNIMASTLFISDGYGLKGGFRWNKGKAEVYSVLKSLTGDRKLTGASVNYVIRDEVSVRHTAEVFNDYVEKVNGNIISNTADVKLPGNGNLSLKAGVGMEQSIAEPKAGDRLWGSSLGYNLQWSNKRLFVLSNIMLNSNSFPGFLKGQRLQVHELRLLNKQLFVGGFYEYNSRSQSYFTDSILVKDAFNVLNRNYGIRSGWSTNRGSFIISGGKQYQEQANEASLKIDYKYVNLNATYKPSNNSFINVNASAGLGSALNYTQASNVFISTIQSTVQVHNAGFTLRYDKGPFYYSDFATYVQSPQDFQRIIFSPYASTSILKKNLDVKVQWNYSHSTPSQMQSSNIMLNLAYHSNEHGWNAQLSGIIPFQPKEANPYISLSVRKQLVAPLPIQKYHQLKIILFKDKNCNGIFDSGEERIAGQTVRLNGNLFESNQDGEIYYKNIDNGNYKLEFSSSVKKWSPTAGQIQNVTVAGNTIVRVPFCRSRLLQGSLVAVKDSLSTNNFNPANIRVKAIGSNNDVYTTLTNEKGEFFFNLPADNYTVILNEGAFDEKFRPSQFSQIANLNDNQDKNLQFNVVERKRVMNINRIPSH